MKSRTKIKRLAFLLFVGVFALIFLQESKSQDYDQYHRITQPGLQVKILSVTIPQDRRPVVTFSVADGAGNPLDLYGVTTMGPVDARFLIARIKPNETQYTAYTVRTQTGAVLGTVEQATTDSGGTFTFLSDGKYTYTFRTALPENYEATATHTVAVGASRNLTAFDGKTYYDDDTFTFIPAGGEPQVVRDVVGTASCNQCHDSLGAHGGRWNDVKTCVLCHTPQTADPDTGNTVDFKVMIHKIHRGAELPSVRAGNPYRIIGFRQTVFDFSTVEFPTDIRNCQKCHSGASQQDHYLNQLSRATCGSCHDDINWETGANHGPGIAARSDSTCTRCHAPTQAPGNEFDKLSVAGAHLIEWQSSQWPGLVYDILNVTNTAPGQKPVVTFSVKDKNGNVVPLAQLDRLALVIAGPTKDYSQWWSEDPRPSATTDNQGNYTYTFSRALPETAVGTWAVGIEGRRIVKINKDGEEINYRDGGTNAVKYFAVTDSAPVVRRAVVDIAKCNACHDRLSLHGTNRIGNIEHCVLCHNPNQTDANRRTPDVMPAETVDFRVMIHKIHTGEELQNKPYIIYGFAVPPAVGTPVDFSEVRYPTDRRNCEKCHRTDTWLPDRMAKDLLPTITPRGFMNPTKPMAAVCTSCHDGVDVAAHAQLNTTSFGEACTVCHGEGKEFSVRKAHSRVDTRSF